MEELNDHPYREQLGPMLRQLRQRIRRIQILRGSARLAALVLGGLLVIAAADYFFAPLPTVVRWVLPFAWLAATITGAVVWLAKPLSQRLGLVRLARWLETRHPELDERVSTVLEVAKHPGGSSLSLLDELAVSAEGGLSHISPKTEVGSKRALEWAVPATLLAIVWVILFITSPGNTARHVVRALIPTSQLGNAAGRIEVDPGDIELLEDESLTITARWLGDGKAPNLEVVIHLPDGTRYNEPMMPADDGQVFHLGKVDQSFRYEVRSGRIISDRFRVDLRPIPRVLDPRLRLDYPAYTNWAPGNVGLGGNSPEATTAVSAIANTRFVLSSKLNTPVESAHLEIDGQPVSELHIERAADGGLLTASFTRTEPGTAEARLTLRHPLGREFDALSFIIETRPDEAPQIRWLAPVEDKLRLPPTDIFAFRYEASDDVGINTVSLEVNPASGEPGRFPLDLPRQVDRTEIPLWRGDGEQAIGAWVDRWPKGRQFRVRFRCADGRPADLDGPGTAYSEWKTISIDREADGLAQQEVHAQDSDVRESLAKAKEELSKARQILDRQEKNVAKEELAEHAKNEFDRAAENLEQARQELEDLASRMEEGVHAAETPKVEQAAETIAEAIQDTERLPLSEDPQARQEDLTKARKNAREAEQQLEKLQQDVQKRQEQIQDLSKLRELEQQQQELARQATEDMAAEASAEPQTPPDPEWQQEQQEMAEALASETSQRPEAKAATLEQQAEQAQALAKQAREAAAAQEQLESIAEQADQSSEGAQQPESSESSEQESPESTSEALRDALAQAQQDLAEQADQQLADSRQRRDAAADILPEASDSAHQAAEALGAEKPEPTPKQGMESGASESGESPSESAGDAAKAEALGDLAEQQAQLAEAIEAFAEGNESEAMRQLAELEAAEAGALAEAIADMPQMSGPSAPMQQAGDAAEAGAQQAEAAAEAGESGAMEQAAAAHESSADSMADAAEALEQAASEFQQQAEQAASQPGKPGQAPAPGESLAEAFSEAAQAASSDSPPQAASHANAAAEALSQAARQAMSTMQGRGKTKPGQPMPGDQPGEQNEEGPRPQQADQGVPPELAKLGISADDWARIKSSLRAEIGASTSADVPEEYRGLVRQYFEQMAKGGSDE